MAGELERRRVLSYPPFARLVLLRLDGTDEQVVERAATHLAERPREHATTLGAGGGGGSRARRGDSAARVEGGTRAALGPASAPVARFRGRYRRQILLRSTTVPTVRAL